MENRPSRRFLIRTAILAALMLGAIGTTNWRVDPLQLYRPAKYPPFLVEQGRFRNPGLARHASAPLVFIGTSISDHFEERDIAAALGKDTLNIAMQGASAHEQFLALRLALKTGRVRTVVWEAHFEYLRGRPDWVSDYDGAFPAYLYDDKPWNDLTTYLLSIDTCKSTAKILLGKYPRKSNADFHRINPSTRYGPEAIAKKMERRFANPEGFRAQVPEFLGGQPLESFRQNVMSLAREYPGVEFHIWLPPFASAYFDFLRKVAPELPPEFLAMRRGILAEAASAPNVTLHDLQADTAIFTDLAHYADPIHFDRATNLRILDAIRDRTHLCTSESLGRFEAWLKESGQPR